MFPQLDEKPWPNKIIRPVLIVSILWDLAASITLVSMDFFVQIPFFTT